MNLESLVRCIDAPTARAFVTAARHVIDALLIEAERAQQAQPPQPTDYQRADLPRSTPPGGWLSHAELRRTAQEMSEAVAAERWTDGVLTTLRAIHLLGGL